MFRSKLKFWFGVGILILLIVSYFIEIEVNDLGSITETSLLGLLIFYNQIVLVFYVLIALWLIFKGLKIKLI